MTDILFVKNVPISIVQHGQDSRKVLLCVSVDIEHITSPVSRKVVVVRLTDEQDMLFLYHMRMTEEEYRCFKDEKHLVFGFDEFPQILVDYLDCCIEQDSEDDRELFAQLSFSVADRAEFHIMQFIKLPSTSDRLSKSSSKNVKRDSILPLDLLKGTDSDVKCYLANCLHSVHEKCVALQKDLSDTESDLSDTRAALASRCQELSTLTETWTSKLNDVAARHNDELTAERQKALELQANMHQRIERERKELEQGHVRIIKEYESRIRDLDSTNRELADTKRQLETTAHDLTMKQSLLEAENKRLQMELETVRQDFTSLGSDRSEQEREMSQVRMKLAVTEQDLKMKDEQLMHAADELSFERDAKRKLEEEVERKRRHLREQMAIIKDKASDINKANELITKLQNDNIAFHTEVKVRRMTIVEQEKVLNEKAQIIDELRRSLDAAESTLRANEVELKDTKDKMDECLQRLRESRDKIKENENVIQYLSRNMTDMQLSQQQQLRQQMSAGLFEMSSSHSRPPVAVQVPVTSSSSSLGATSSRLSASQFNEQSPPTADAGRFSAAARMQFENAANEVPMPPLSNSTPISGGGGVPSDMMPSKSGTAVHRDDGIDPKYLQPDEIPPPTRLPVPGVGRGGVSRGGAVGRGAVTGGAVVRGGGGGSALSNSAHRSRDVVQGTSTSRPISRPPQLSQPPQLPAGAPPLHVPLTSSYFPSKS